MGKTAIYFPTWASSWVANAKDMDLAQLASNLPGVGIVYLSFAKPDCSYLSQQRNFTGTGLEFSQEFSVVAEAIQILKRSGVTVMLSVGGGAYWSSTKTLNAKACSDLMEDLGCDGIDIDWEGHATEDKELTAALTATRAAMPFGKFLSFAGFSTGAYGKDGDTYKGNAIDAMVKNNSIIDWINIMAYDAGSSYDPLGAFDCYRIYYKGPLYLGFQPGQQGWGGHLTNEEEVIRNCNYVKNSDPKHGIFVWCYKKTGAPDAFAMMNTCYTILNGKTAIPYVPPVAMPTPVFEGLICPVCMTKYKKE